MAIPNGPTTHPVPNIDADIYLDHSTIENGCVWVIPGHHLVGHVEVENFSEEALFEELGAAPVEMEPGDVSFHCISAPHGSAGNRTGDLRRTFYIHYLNAETQYQCYGQKDRIQKLKDRLGLFDARALAAVQKMIATRKELGYGGLDGRQFAPGRGRLRVHRRAEDAAPVLGHVDSLPCPRTKSGARKV